MSTVSKNTDILSGYNEYKTFLESIKNPQKEGGRDGNASGTDSALGLTAGGQKAGHGQRKTSPGQSGQAGSQNQGQFGANAGFNRGTVKKKNPGGERGGVHGAGGQAFGQRDGGGKMGKTS